MNSAQKPLGKASGSIQLWIQVKAKASEKVGVSEGDFLVIFVGGRVRSHSSQVDMGDNKKNGCEMVALTFYKSGFGPYLYIYMAYIDKWFKLQFIHSNRGMVIKPQ